MRRILLLITDLQIGGTPTVVRELAVRLNAPPAVVVDVACLSPWGPVASQLVSRGVHVTALNAAGPHDVGAVKRLMRLITAGKYDTVFSFLVHANFAAAAASKLCRGVRWIQSIQTTQPDPRWHWWAQSAAGHAAEKIVVPSVSAAKVARDRTGAPDDKIVVIPNAIEPADFPTVRGAEYPGTPAFLFDGCDGDITPEQQSNRVGFIGRLDPIKCIPDLIAAMRLLRPEVELHIYGEGVERPYLEALIAHWRLKYRVFLHGAVSRPQLALREINVLVLPSAAEGFGLVLIEAMASGIPVIGTDVPGIRDVIQNGQNGLLAPPGSPEELAAAIRSVLTNTRLRAQLVATGRGDVAERFTWNSVLPAYRELLELKP